MTGETDGSAKTCCCPSRDARECISIRYPRFDCIGERLEFDPTDDDPCDCRCHDPDEDEDWEPTGSLAMEDEI